MLIEEVLRVEADKGAKQVAVGLVRWRLDVKVDVAEVFGKIVRADRKLAAVTESSRPAPQAGDTIVSLGPPPAALRLGTDAGAAATGDTASPEAAPGDGGVNAPPA